MTSIKNLATAIGYPDEVANDATEFTFMVDDGEIRARETNARLYLERSLWKESDDADGSGERLLVKLAGLAAGRILREEAAPAWDARRGELVLVQDAPASFTSDRLVRFFEVFTASCDWWLERISDEQSPAPVFPEMMIMP